MASHAEGQPVISLTDAGLAFGDRILWRELNLDIYPGEFIAVLGPNGAGKTTFLKVLLGQQPLSAGSVTMFGEPVRRGWSGIGYIPQQRSYDPSLPLRARDLVDLGLDGHRFALHHLSRKHRQAIDTALDAVGARHYAEVPVGLLSGGEQQRLRVAQALINDPSVLLCDEPLLSLDLAHQHAVSELIDQRRKNCDTAVVFITHEVNPVLPMVDRVLYLVDGRFRIGTVDEVMTSAGLSELYRAPIQMLRVDDRLIVLGGSDHAHHLQSPDEEVISL